MLVKFNYKLQSSAARASNTGAVDNAGCLLQLKLDLFVIAVSCLSKFTIFSHLWMITSDSNKSYVLA